ncbi:MAG TPA: pitrilysin family protein [Actinomycetota bacterium]|nr:pitrilysin family protein [Actinomycetota bacterium]
MYLVENHTLPTVSMQLVFAGGSADDPKGKEGLASVCMGLLSDGTEKLDKIAFSEALGDLASSIGSYAGVDEQAVTLSSLTKNLDPTLDLFVDTLLRPGMRADEFDRTIKKRLESLKQIKASPQGIAGRVAGPIAYGDDHPYGRVWTEASTKALEVEDCRAYVKSWIQPANAKLFVVGDVTRKDVEEKVGKRLASWKGKAKTPVAIPAPKPRKGKVFLVDVPGTPQALVRIMHGGPKRQDEDYVTNSLMVSILGGGFSSRINMNIREEKGWAYGAYGGFSYARNFGLFSAGGSILVDKTADSIQEILREIERMKKEPVTEGELARERDGAILSLPASWATGAQVLSTYRSLVYYGLPLDWYSSYVPKVKAVTVGDVQAAAQEHLKQDVQILVVGDAEKVAPELAKLGPILRLDADAKPTEQAR